MNLVSCYCVNTQCHSNYCICRKNNQGCTSDCCCQNCQNIIFEPIEAELRLVPPCNCIKSHCQKGYCECYKHGKSCSKECECTACANGGDPSERPPRAVKVRVKKLRRSAMKLEYETKFMHRLLFEVLSTTESIKHSELCLQITEGKNHRRLHDYILLFRTLRIIQDEDDNSMIRIGKVVPLDSIENEILLPLALSHSNKTSLSYLWILCLLSIASNGLTIKEISTDLTEVYPRHSQERRLYDMMRYLRVLQMISFEAETKKFFLCGKVVAATETVGFIC